MFYRLPPSWSRIPFFRRFERVRSGFYCLLKTWNRTGLWWSFFFIKLYRDGTHSTESKERVLSGFHCLFVFFLLLFLLPNGDGLVIGCFPIEFSPRFTGFLDAGLRMPARSQRSRTRRRPIEKERERERTKEWKKERKNEKEREPITIRAGWKRGARAGVIISP